MLPFRRLALSSALILAAAAPALAQDSTRRVPVVFAGTETSVALAGTLKGYDSVDYILTAEAGQMLDMVLETDNASANFNVIPPGSDSAVFIGSTAGTVFNTTASASGDYTVQVYLMRNAARRDEVATYTLTITKGGPPPADFADALAGGPDFWQVAGLSDSGRLNLRREAAVTAEIVTRFRNGDVLRNKGCQMVAEARWCQVEAASDARLTGWVAGQYLRETASPDSAGDMLTEAGFNAEGMVKCAAGGAAPDQDCAFGVHRSSTGATILLSPPGGGAQRALTFAIAGQVFAVQDGTAATWLRQGDNWLVSLADGQVYLIPDALIFGG